MPKVYFLTRIDCSNNSFKQGSSIKNRHKNSGVGINCLLIRPEASKLSCIGLIDYQKESNHIYPKKPVIGEKKSN